MNFSRDQIIWIQEWLTKIEQNEEAFFELRRLLFRMKQELAESASTSSPRDSGTDAPDASLDQNHIPST